MRGYFGIKLSQGQFDELVKKEKITVCRGFDGRNITFALGVEKIDTRKKKLLEMKEELNKRLETIDQELNGGHNYSKRRYKRKTCSICGKEGFKNLGQHINYIHNGKPTNLPNRNKFIEANTNGTA